MNGDLNVGAADIAAVDNELLEVARLCRLLCVEDDDVEEEAVLSLTAESGRLIGEVAVGVKAPGERPSRVCAVCQDFIVA